jgi:DNA invertase Pin-like site-specific DNA recombinase
VFAEFETNLRRERHLEGIAKAKAAGVFKGRPASMDAAQVREMKAQGLGASEIAKAFKIGRAPMRNVEWIVISPTVTYVLLVAFALWVGLGH